MNFALFLLIFQSYLHHIRVISLFYNDFGNIWYVSYFYEFTLHRQKTLFLSFNVSGAQTTSKSPANLRASIFGRKKTWERRKQANGAPRAKRGGPTRPLYLAAWDPTNWASTLCCRRSFLHRLWFDLKPTIKIAPRRSLEGAPQKHRNTETEIWSCRLEGKTLAGCCRCVLHLLHRHLHRLHDEEGVVHPWTMGLCK